MATQIGRYVKISTMTETAYGGTTNPNYGNGNTMMPVANFQPIRVSQISYPVDRGLLQEENIDYFIPTAQWGGALKVTGTLTGYLRPKQMELLLYAVMGASAALGAGDPITSGVKYTMAWPQPFQMKIGESTLASTTDLELGYMGVGLKSAAFTFAQADFTTVAFDWFAKLYTAASPFSPPAQADYLSENPILFYNATVSLSQSTLYPAAMMTVKSAVSTIENPYSYSVS